jgi:diguanylate cyclase (GGDEF)-like protein
MRSWSRAPGAHVALAAALVVLVPAYLLTDDLTRDVVSAAAAAVPMLALGILLARHRLAGPRPWWLLLAGLLVLGGYTVAWMIQVHVVGSAPTGPLMSLAPPLSYLLFLAAAVTAVTWPVRGPRDGTVDAAVFAVSTSMFAWALLIGPYLDRLALPLAVRVRTLAMVVVLGATAGALAGTAWAFRAQRRPVAYLLVAAVASTAGAIARQLTTSPQQISGAWWVGLLWILGFSAVTAAVLDPTARVLAPQLQPRKNRITPARLFALGASLCVGPTIALAQTAFGLPVDGLLIGVGSIALVPLVLVRIAQLARLRAAAEERLAHLAHHDELTGLANRRRLHAHVSDALDRTDRGETGGVVVLFCDVDDFKQVNDDHGHRVGDEVLLLITRRLRSAVRAGDLVARLGGDEFVVVVEGDPATTEAETLARVEDALAEPVLIGSVLAPTAVSVGSASARRGERVTSEELLAAADASMYARKRARRSDRPQVDLSELDRAELDLAESERAEVDLAEVDLAEVDLAEVDLADDAVSHQPPARS